MKKSLLLISIAVSAILTQSCDLWLDGVEEETQTVQLTVGAYILNSGTWGGNDSSLSMFGTLSDQIVDSCFIKANNRQLGDTGQDITVYGSKMYIAVYGSGIVYVLDKYTCRIVGEIAAQSPATGAKLSPRNFAKADGSVFVSYYEGYAGKIDTTSLSLTAIAEVGANPEELAVASGRLYVANSGGMNYPDYGHTVSVLKCSDLSTVETIEVELNPVHMAVDSENDIYLVSMGNYADIPSCLQRITTADNKVTKVESVANPYLIAKGIDNQLVVVTSYYDDKMEAHYGIVNYNTSSSVESRVGSFISDGTSIDNICSVSIDDFTGSVYFGISDYVNTGDLFIYTYDGIFYGMYDTGGINPIKAAFVKNYD